MILFHKIIFRCTLPKSAILGDGCVIIRNKMKGHVFKLKKEYVMITNSYLFSVSEILIDPVEYFRLYSIPQCKSFL